MATMTTLLCTWTSLFFISHAADADDIDPASRLEAESATLFREEDCPRLRRPFHTLNEDERMLYVNGFQALRQNGKLETIATTHAANVAVHKGSSFFFLHAYMIWEAETAIRDLGGEYSCFSMPYWDYTMDAGLEHDPTIFHLDVGANGDNRHDFCMFGDPLWGDTTRYWSTDADTCFDDEVRSPPQCCLKRSVSDSQLLPSTAQIASVFVLNANFLKFETQIDHYHVWPHFYLAVNTRSQMATAFAVDDPLFFLLHTFTLYQLDLWRTCYEYDEIAVYELESHPDAYTPSCNPNMDECGVVGIDAPYNLNPMDETEWALAAKMDITPRMLWNPKIWNVQYDLGSFYVRSKLNEWCQSTATHGDTAGPDPDLFVDLSAEWDGAEMLSSLRSNDLHDFIEETWAALKAEQEALALSDEELYYAVESISCKFHRENGLNSCFDAEDEAMSKRQYETCESRDIHSAEEVTLDEMLGFDGVADSECLRKRRQQLYALSDSELFDDAMALRLCNGEYDYFCPEWEHREADRVAAAVKANFNRKRVAGQFTFGAADSANYAVASFVVFGIVILCAVAKLCCFTMPRRKHFDDGDHALSQHEEDLLYGTF